MIVKKIWVLGILIMSLRSIQVLKADDQALSNAPRDLGISFNLFKTGKSKTIKFERQVRA